MRRMRCGTGNNGCGRRFRIPRHPDSYRRSPKCPHCGSVFVRDVTEERMRENRRRATCRCRAYPFPHRRASLRMCHWFDDGGLAPTRAEELAFEACLLTPRGSECSHDAEAPDSLAFDSPGKAATSAEAPF